MDRCKVESLQVKRDIKDITTNSYLDDYSNKLFFKNYEGGGVKMAEEQDG